MANAARDGLAAVQCSQFAFQQELELLALVVRYRLTAPVTPPSMESLYAGCMGR
jgi:hypothetical protein